MILKHIFKGGVVEPTVALFIIHIIRLTSYSSINKTSLTEVGPWICLLMSKEAAALSFFHLRAPPSALESPYGLRVRVPNACASSLPRLSLKMFLS